MGFDYQNAILDVLLLWILTAPHEFAHAWAADRLGDDTPRLMGRLTLNPLAHVDWIGTAILPFLCSALTGGFIGWGKSVLTDTRKLRHGARGLTLVALAGPGANIVMAFILAIAATITALFHRELAFFIVRGVALSLYLALFNLLPVPPLDGSRLLLLFRIPAAIYQELARGGIVLLMVAVGYFGVGRWLSELAMLGTKWIFALMPHSALLRW